MGFDCVAALLLQVEPSKTEKIEGLLEKIPDVFGPFRSTSKFNLRIVVTLKNIYELESLKENLRRKLSVTEIASSIWTDIWLIPENLTLLYTYPSNPKESMKLLTTPHSKRNFVLKADEIDFQMIRELAKDSRVSFRKLSAKLEVSTDTVARRFEKMKHLGIIVPRIQIDLEKIGYQATTLFFLKISHEYKISEIINEISRIPDIFYIMESTGDYSLGAMLMVKDIKNLLKTGDLISKIQGIQRIETTVQSLSKKWPIARTYTSAN